MKNRRLRYGGPWFAAASSLPLDQGFIQSGMLRTFLITAVCRPRRTIALFGLLLGTRSEYVPLSDSQPGHVLREYFSRRSLGVLPVTRFCRGVLVLPRDHAEYMRGRRRQALRTNLRRGIDAGIRCELVNDRSLTPEELASLLKRRREWAHPGDADRLSAMLARSDLTFIVARATTGRPMAFAGVVIDDSIALLQFAVADDHDARWMLHDHLVRMLIDRGVSYLVADGGGPFGALGFPPAVQHYQHLLGYELRHVVPSPALP